MPVYALRLNLAVTCTAPIDQECDPATTPVSVQSVGSLQVDLTIGSGACSDLSFKIFVDGNLITTTAFVGPLASSTSTGQINLGNFSVGTHMISVQGVGRVGGCNTIGVGNWEAQMVVSTSPATAVALRSVSATWNRAGVLVRWRSAAGIDVLGFNVYRETNGKRTRVNGRLIRATARRSYSLLDRKATRNAPPRYWIQVVHLDGSRAWYGPAKVARVGGGAG